MEHDGGKSLPISLCFINVSAGLVARIETALIHDR